MSVRWPVLLCRGFLQLQLLSFPRFDVPEWRIGLYNTRGHLLKRCGRSLYAHIGPNTAPYRCLLGSYSSTYGEAYDYSFQAPEWSAYTCPIAGSDVLHLVFC